MGCAVDSSTAVRIAQKTMRQGILDAKYYARRGIADEENEALIWLWDVGREWALVIYGERYRRYIVNLCEKISIIADTARANGKRATLQKQDISHL